MHCAAQALVASSVVVSSVEVLFGRHNVHNLFARPQLEYLGDSVIECLVYIGPIHLIKGVREHSGGGIEKRARFLLPGCVLDV